MTFGCRIAAPVIESDLLDAPYWNGTGSID